MNDYFKTPFLLVAILLSTVLVSCKKKERVDIEINGNITDKSNSAGVSGASVTLQVQEIQSGTFNSGFNIIEKVNTSSNGSYNFVFERRNASAYRLLVSASGYFSDETDINPDALNLNETNTRDIQLTPESWLKINIHNTNPFDANDLVSFQITSGAYNCGNACCNGDEIQLGGDVDTTIYCLNSGGHDLTLQGVSVKNGSPTSFTKTVYMTPMDTSTIQIDY